MYRIISYQRVSAKSCVHRFTSGACRQGSLGLTGLMLILLLVGFLVALPLISYFRTTVSADSSTVFARAKVALDERRYTEVNEAIEQLSTDPEYKYHVQFLRGASLIKLGFLQEGFEDLRQSVEEPELRIEAMLMCGMALANASQYPEANGFLSEVLNQEPTNVDAHRMMAIMAYNTGAMENARLHLLEIGRLAPEDPRPYRTLGRIRKDFERYREAISDYRESLRRNPYQNERQQILMEMAECQIELLRYADALKTLKKANKTVPRNILQAKCYRALSQPEVAIKLADEAIAGDPNNQQAVLIRGLLAIDANDLSRAKILMQRAVALEPEDDIAHYQLLRVLQELGETKAAEQQLAVYQPLRRRRLKFARLNTQAISEPENADVRFELGEIAKDMGKLGLARMWYQQALGLSPAMTKAGEKIAEIEQMTRARQLPQQGPVRSPQVPNNPSTPRPQVPQNPALQNPALQNPKPKK